MYYVIVVVKRRFTYFNFIFFIIYFYCGRNMSISRISIIYFFCRIIYIVIMINMSLFYKHLLTILYVKTALRILHSATKQIIINRFYVHIFFVRQNRSCTYLLIVRWIGKIIIHHLCPLKKVDTNGSLFILETIFGQCVLNKRLLLRDLACLEQTYRVSSYLYLK